MQLAKGFELELVEGIDLIVDVLYVIVHGGVDEVENYYEDPLPLELNVDDQEEDVECYYCC